MIGSPTKALGDDRKCFSEDSIFIILNERKEKMNAGKLSFIKSGSLSVVQFRTDNADTFRYISLSNALKNKFAEINEISESGSVNDLNLSNHSEHFIFISDGDILSGAKQNRVLNTSVLVPPGSKLTIPVSCV